MVLASLGAMMKFLSGCRDFHGTACMATMAREPVRAHRAMAVTPAVNDNTGAREKAGEIRQDPSAESPSC
jgi:hypothetical protein